MRKISIMLAIFYVLINKIIIVYSGLLVYYGVQSICRGDHNMLPKICTCVDVLQILFLVFPF